ncbi:MAG: ABC transporter substrate-binding protein [Defluviitaleaceae bacterium]|nr:ABC transporter substrate-binding protein [Defluviitaleaceae bacterium]
MRKLIMALLLVALVVVLAACNNNATTDPTEPTTTAPTGDDGDGGRAWGDLFPNTPSDHVPTQTRAQILANIPEFTPAGSINVASGTTASVNIMAGWDNIAVNAQARRLIWDGLNTHDSNMDRVFFENPMVLSEPVRVQDDQYFPGTRTYTYNIYTDNLWSDGRPVTAHDYAGGILWVLHPYHMELRINPPSGAWIVGRDEFIRGETDVLSGVRIYSDASFSVTILHEGPTQTFLPYVWETALYVNQGPAPLHGILPGFDTQAQVVDTGEGVQLVGLTRELVASGINGVINEVPRVDADNNPVLNADGDPVMDIVGGTGWRFAPTVFSGPYMFHSLDPSNFTMVLRANPNFVGTWDGFRPRIETVIFSVHLANVVIDSLVAGEADMVSGQGQGSVVNDMMTFLVEAGTHDFESYPRNGYGLIRFHVDHGPTQFTEVRQAIKWLIDREEFMEQFTLGHGTLNHGPYGSAQWWTIQAIQRGMYDRIIMYTLNPENAIARLEEGGWVLNAQGNPFDPAVDSVRYKDVTGVAQLPNALPFADDPMVTSVNGRQLMRLDIQWATWTADANRITEIIEILVVDEMRSVGMEITPHRVANPLTELSRGGDNPNPQFHMFNQGTTFAQVWAPWYLFDPNLHGVNNLYHTSDPVLFEAANRLRVGEIDTQAGRDAFVDAFMDLVEVLNREVVEIPLYVDTWFDFYPTWVGNWHMRSQWFVDDAIIRAYDSRATLN